MSSRRTSRLANAIAITSACAALVALSSCSDDDKADSNATAIGSETSPDADTGSDTNTGSSEGVDSGAPGIELDAQGGQAGPQLCELFGTADVGDWMGTDVGEGEVVAPLDSGCQWDGSDGSVLMIQVLSSDYYSAPELSDGYQELSGIGDEAYAAPGMFNDRVASALTGDMMTIVSVERSSDDDAVSVAVLKASVPAIAP